jgi:hypothetical protein
VRLKYGHTLVEMLVSLGIGALIVGLTATIGFRHQRFHRDVIVAVERSEQLDQVVALTPIGLRGIAPGEGDIAAGAARDTSIEFRATIATAVVCDSATTVALLAPAGVTPRLASFQSRPESGDTAWFLDTSTLVERWVGRPIAAVFDSVGRCMLGTTLPFGTAPLKSIAIRLAAVAPAGSSALRITRPFRSSLYRASDGAWYLGAKDWNPSAGRFNTIQPVAGPLASASANGLRFRYFDSLGALLPGVPPDPRSIAAIEASFRVDSGIPGKYAHATTIRNRAVAFIALRNRVR